MEGVKRILTEFGKGFAWLAAALTFTSLVFEVLVDGNDFMRWFFPPAPLQGEWSGQLEGDTVKFCFQQKKRLVWGEYQRPGSSDISSIEGIVIKDVFTLSYAGLDRNQAVDHGVYVLNYHKSSADEYLEGFWKSEVDVLNRDTIHLNRLADHCELRRRPFK